MSWESFREENQEEYERFLMEMEGATVRLFGIIESFTDEQLEFLLRLCQGPQRSVWQFSGAIASEQHRRSMRVPDG